MRNKEFRFPVTVLIGSEISNLRKIAHGKQIDPGFRVKYGTTAAVSTILTAFSKIDSLINARKIKNFEITEPPVFIIAFWRSGTTLLHNLLCQNPEFGFVSTFQTVFPNHTLSNQWWLKFVASPFLPEKRPADDVKFEWNNPQEEEMALGNMQEISFYNFMYFPKELNEYAEKGLMLDKLSPDELKKWKEDYLRLMKIALLNTGGKRLISKNPPNAFRIKQLLEMFPEAKFINIKRNPEEVIFSFKRFITEVLKGTALQEINEEMIDKDTRYLYDLYTEIYNRDKHLIPEGNLIEVDYHEFVKDKHKCIKQIYDELALEGYEKALPRMNQYLEDTKDFKPWDFRNKKGKKKEE
jgi:hypothetical protein